MTLDEILLANSDWGYTPGGALMSNDTGYPSDYFSKTAPPAPEPTPPSAPSAPSAPSSGGGSAPPAYTTRPQTEEQIRAQQLIDAKKAQEAAYAYGLGKIQTGFTDYGLDYNNYQSDIDRYLQSIKETIDPYDASAKQYYTGDLFDTLRGQIETKQVGEYQNQLDQFLGAGWTNNYVNDSLGESTLNSILSQQYGDASSAMDRARDRGTLTDEGYNYAMAQLAQQQQAGYSVMDSLRDGIVAGYRQDLEGQGQNAYQRLNSFSLGDTFDPNKVQTDINDYYRNQKAGFGGDFRADFGGQELFDWNSLIQKGGINQGVSNQTKTSPIVSDALAQRDEDDDTNRGLGSQGVF